MSIKDIILIENDIKSLQNPMSSEMEKAIKHLETELVKIRTGRAHTSMIEDLQVSVYGQPAQSLKGLAALAAPDIRLLTIQPWDISILADIEKAIMNSDLGIKPANDGKLIRISLPEPSGSRREELVKTLGKKIEEARIALRNVRKEFHNLIRDAKKDRKIS
jgi:ribosome recycling factor